MLPDFWPDLQLDLLLYQPVINYFLRFFVLWQDFYVSNSQISVRNVDPNRPGSFLNGEDGRQTERVNTIGPVAAEEKYVSHEYYNHDKVFFESEFLVRNYLKVLTKLAIEYS